MTEMPWTTTGLATTANAISMSHGARDAWIPYAVAYVGELGPGHPDQADLVPRDDEGDGGAIIESSYTGEGEGLAIAVARSGDLAVSGQDRICWRERDHSLASATRAWRAECGSVQTRHRPK